MAGAVVYEATSPSGGRYIGVTSQVPRKRWRFHISAARRGTSKCRVLAAAIVKHGMTEANFRCVAGLPNLALAKLVERVLIQRTRPEYNRTAGGDCAPRHTAETRAKIGAASRGNKHAAKMLGRRASAETRIKMAASQRARRSAEARS